MLPVLSRPSRHTARMAVMGHDAERAFPGALASVNCKPSALGGRGAPLESALKNSCPFPHLYSLPFSHLSWARRSDPSEKGSENESSWKRDSNPAGFSTEWVVKLMEAEQPRASLRPDALCKTKAEMERHCWGSFSSRFASSPSETKGRFVAKGRALPARSGEERNLLLLISLPPFRRHRQLRAENLIFEAHLEAGDDPRPLGRATGGGLGVLGKAPGTRSRLPTEPQNQPRPMDEEGGKAARFTITVNYRR